MSSRELQYVEKLPSKTGIHKTFLRLNCISFQSVLYWKVSKIHHHAFIWRIFYAEDYVSKISWRKIYLPGTAGTLYRVSWLLYLWWNLGWRGFGNSELSWNPKDLVDAFQKLHPPVIRWPGGCFADVITASGLAAEEQRPVTYNENFGTFETDPNQFGTHEMMEFARWSARSMV